MVKVNNPLQSPLDSLFERLNLINGLLFHLNNQLDVFKKILKERWNDSGLDLSYLGAGSALVIRDLTEWPINGWARYYPSGKFTSRGEEFFKVSNELVCHGALWTISQAYEAFETFIKDLAACFMHQHQDQVDQERLKKHHRKLDKKGLSTKNFDYWQRFVRLAYRNNNDLLGYFRSLSPDVEETEKRNNRAFDIAEWYKVIEEARHASTHSGGVIKKPRMQGWASDKLVLLDKFISGLQVAEGYKMDPGFNEANQNLVIFSEYGFALFKALSKLKGYHWNILKKSGTKNNA